MIADTFWNDFIREMPSWNQIAGTLVLGGGFGLLMQNRDFEWRDLVALEMIFGGFLLFFFKCL